MPKITSIKQLDKGQKANLQASKDLVKHLFETGAMKEIPTEEKIEKTFLQLLNEKLQKEAGQKRE